MKVAAYYNLHKNTFSLQSRNKEDYGKVIKHTDHVILKNAKFTVRSAGRQKVLNENKKNVHAFVVGEVVEGLGPERSTEKHSETQKRRSTLAWRPVTAWKPPRPN